MHDSDAVNAMNEVGIVSSFDCIFSGSESLSISSQGSFGPSLRTRYFAVDSSASPV